MMRFEGQNGLSLLHDLALLYLGLAEGADDELDASERQEVGARLRRWQPNRDPALIDHVMRDVALSYREERIEERLDEAIESLGESLPKGLRTDILRDLAEIARADGTVLDAEKTFIRRVAEAWHLEDFENISVHS